VLFLNRADIFKTVPAEESLKIVKQWVLKQLQEYHAAYATTADENVKIKCCSLHIFYGSN
jgi:hypothetical protein